MEPIAFGSKECPDIEGIKTLILRGPAAQNGVRRNALISKGLRPKIDVFHSATFVRRNALISKGLRRRFRAEGYCYAGSKECPDIEGIKTPAPFLPWACQGSKECPDIEGIKTVLVERPECDRSSKECPDIEGIKTRYLALWSRLHSVRRNALISKGLRHSRGSRRHRVAGFEGMP